MSESPAGWTGLADLRRSSALALGLIAALAGSLAAQSAPAPAPRSSVGPPAATRPLVPAPEELRLHVFTLQHQRAIEALAVIRPLLSVRGAVDLDETANTLAVRDTLASLSRVTMALRAFDHAAQPLRFEVQLVHAETSAVSPVPQSDDLDPALLAKLKQLLRFQHYALIGRAAIDSREGEQVTYQMGDRYRLAFRVGTVVDDRRVRLSELRMVRLAAGAPERELVHTSVNLGLQQPLILGLTRDESANRALMLVLRCERPRASP